MRISALSEINDSIRMMDSKISDVYLNHMSHLVKGTPIKAMLGNTTVVDQNTFETRAIMEYMRSITSALEEHWSSRDVIETRDEDIRRIFVKFESRVLEYLISVHLSVQFRALLYYKPDARVITIQKELSEIESTARDHKDRISDIGDRLISDRLRNMGHTEPDHVKLFEMLYNDDSLADEMASDLQNAASNAGLDKFVDKKDVLFEELNSLLMEVYNTTPVMIDENRLVTGEDGFLYAVDIQKITQDSRTGTIAKEGSIAASDLSDDALCAIESRFAELYHAIIKLQ